MSAEEALMEYVAQSEKLVKELKHLSDRLEKQIETAKKYEGCNHDLFFSMCRFRSILSHYNPILRHLQKTLRTLPDIEKEFAKNGEEGFREIKFW